MNFTGIIILRKNSRKYVDQIKSASTVFSRLILISEDNSLSEKVNNLSFIKSEKNSNFEHYIKIFSAILSKNANYILLTFLESDLILASEISGTLNIPGPQLNLSQISRNKLLQRNLLIENNLPTPSYVYIKDKSELTNNTNSIVFPAITKPTNSSLSLGVRLVKNKHELIGAFNEAELINKNKNYFENSEFGILIEEYLPGEEITVDGVIISGKFYLGGIHNKKKNNGPTFEEDLYSLPFKHPELEREITEIISKLTSSLSINNSLFNAELRQDVSGKFKIVEFSNRLSGAYCHRHIKYVYTIDLVALYCKAICGIKIKNDDLLRSNPRCSTCTKWIFGTGIVKKNSPGDIINSPYFDDYYKITLPDHVVNNLSGINCIARFSLKGPYDSINDVLNLENEAVELEKLADIKVSSD